jgi:hypothetical protein
VRQHVTPSGYSESVTCCGTGLPGRKLSVEAVKRNPPARLCGSGGGRGGPQRTPDEATSATVGIGVYDRHDINRVAQ